MAARNGARSWACSRVMLALHDRQPVVGVDSCGAVAGEVLADGATPPAARAM